MIYKGLKQTKKQPSPEPPTPLKGAQFKKKWSIGVKLAFGVAFASNICILFMLYTIWHWDRQVDYKTRDLVQIQKYLNANLRSSVSNLQEKLLLLPRQFETDIGQKISQWVKTNGEVEDEKTIKGRRNYGSMFSRAQRRDLAKGKFIIQEKSNRIIITRGILSPDGQFSDAVHQFILKSDSPVEDRLVFESNIKTMLEKGDSPATIRKKLKAIKSGLAEELINAERTRIAILNRIEQIDASEADLIETKSQKRFIVSIIGLSTILGNILIIILLTRTIIARPMNRVVYGLKRIAMGKGDLTQKLMIRSKDQLGELAHWFNSFVSKLHQIIKQIQGQMKHLASAIRKLSGISDNLSLKASHMNEKSKETALATDATIDNIQKIVFSAKNANEKVKMVTRMSGDVSTAMAKLGQSSGDISSSVSAIATSIEEMHASFKEVYGQTSRGAQVTLQATHQAGETTATINDLRLSAKEIDPVVDLIKGIADQTHLLALNAAIEAAGAGEAGKGFTVVAKEVKELSQMTSEATKTIRNKIHSMQSSSETVIKTMSSIVDIIQETHEIMSCIAASVEEQTATINEISKNIAQTSSFTGSVFETLQNTITLEKMVSKKLDSVSSDAKKIACDAEDAFDQTSIAGKNVAEVKKASLETFEHAKKIENQVQSLGQMYQKLYHIVVQFKLK